MNVLYVAVQDVKYPRNSRIRKYLSETAGSNIDVVTLSAQPGYVRHIVELIREGVKRRRGHYDMVILAELSLVFAPVSWFLARYHRAHHIVDFFVGMFETQVGDRHAFSARSLRGLILRAVDQFARSRADLLLADTEVRARKWSTRRTTALNLPVGAPPWATCHPPRTPQAGVRLLYYGNYIPLHGVPQFLEALTKLEGYPSIELTMVGTGDDRLLAHKMVRDHGLERHVEFVDFMPAKDLAEAIRANDIVIGIFGTSPKADSVIPNKVWQGLASGRVVVTRASAGVAELTGIVGDQLVLAASADPGDIAAALDLAIQMRARSFTDVDVRLESYVDQEYKAFGDWISNASRRSATFRRACRAKSMPRVETTHSRATRRGN